ncbi:MAG: hypothetical protein WBP29_15030 [Candidatus Zixiibacteriota bacterium]
MNRKNLIYSLILILATFGVGMAQERSPEQFRRLVSTELKSKGGTADSIGSPVRVKGYGEKYKDFVVVPVLRGGKLRCVYREDPRRNSVTEVCSEANVKSLRGELFTVEGASREMAKQGVANPAPKLITVGPMSMLGTVTAGWYHDTGESFVLLSLSGRLVTEADIARYWPEHLEALRAVGR